MPAIVTDNFKRRILDTLINDVDSTGVSYHVAIGKSEPYDSADTVIDPIQNIREIRNAQLSMQSVKIITDRSFCIPRYNCCLLYTSPSPRDVEESRMPSSA